MLLILALVFTSLCSSVTPVHADTQTVECTFLESKSGMDAIFTYTLSSTVTTTTVTLTKIQAKNRSGDAIDFSNMFEDRKSVV